MRTQNLQASACQRDSQSAARPVVLRLDEQISNQRLDFEQTGNRPACNLAMPMSCSNAARQTAYLVPASDGPAAIAHSC